MRCEQAASTLADLIEGVEVPAGPASDHIARCLRCQAELAQHRRLRLAMRRMRDQVVAPSPGLVDQVLSAVDAAAGPGTRTQRRHVVAYVAAATAAATATAAGAALLAARTRRTRLAPTG